MKERCEQSGMPVRNGTSPSPRRRRRSLGHSEDGNALVEMALTLPILLLIFTAIFQFGLTLSHYLMLENGVDIAARYLAISRGNTTDPCNLVSSTLQAASPGLITTSLSYTITLNGTAYTSTTCSSSSTSSGASGKLVQGTTASVVVTYPCSLALYGVNLAPTCNLQASTSELVQ